MLSLTSVKRKQTNQKDLNTDTTPTTPRGHLTKKKPNGNISDVFEPPTKKTHCSPQKNPAYLEWKADLPHLPDYPHTPPDNRQMLVMLLTRGGQTDGCYQVHRSNGSGVRVQTDRGGPEENSKRNFFPPGLPPWKFFFPREVLSKKIFPLRRGIKKKFFFSISSGPAPRSLMVDP